MARSPEVLGKRTPTSGGTGVWREGQTRRQAKLEALPGCPPRGSLRELVRGPALGPYRGELWLSGAAPFRWLTKASAGSVTSRTSTTSPKCGSGVKGTPADPRATRVSRPWRHGDPALSGSTPAPWPRRSQPREGRGASVSQAWLILAALPWVHHAVLGQSPALWLSARQLVAGGEPGHPRTRRSRGSVKRCGISHQAATSWEASTPSTYRTPA